MTQRGSASPASLLAGTVLLAIGIAQTGARTGTDRRQACAEGPYARIAILRPHRRRHRGLRSGVHPTPRVAPAGQGHLGVVRMDRLGSANGSGGSSTRRSGTRPPAWTTRWPRRRTSGTTSSNVTPHVDFIGERALRVPARALAWHRRAATDARGSSSRPWTSFPERERRFEAALGARPVRHCRARHSGIGWSSGGAAPRYVRLRPRPSLSAMLEARSEQALPDAVNDSIAKTTVEILTLRPTMSYGLTPARERDAATSVLTRQVRGACRARLSRHVQLDRDGRSEAKPSRFAAIPTTPTRADRCATRSPTTSTTRARQTGSLYPMRRVGPKGSGEFTRISWDEALRAHRGAAARRDRDRRRARRSGRFSAAATWA